MSEPSPRGWLRRGYSALRHSLRLKLIMVFLLLAAGLSVIFLAATQRAIEQGWRLAVAPLLADYVDRLVADIGSPPSITRATALTRRLPVSVRIEGPVVQWRSHPGQDDDDRNHRDGRWHDGAPRLLERQTSDGHRIILGLGDVSWKSQPRVFGWFSLLAVLLVIGAAYAFVRSMLRPIDDIRVGVQRFGRGTFEPAIVVRRHDELGDLADQINTMAHDLRSMLDGKRALLLAISHELRSPLTRARLNTELLPETAGTQSARSALLRDLAQMRDLISDLLEGERLSGSHAALNREPTDLCALVRMLVSDQQDFAGVRLQLPADMARVNVDPVRLRLAVRNLVDNAVRHGGRVQPPVVTITQDAGHVRVAVRDYGPGVGAQHLAHLGEAFYRTDQARQRVTGGVGLGLHLAIQVAQAHGGSLRFRNAEPGLEATLELPLPA